MATYTAPTTRTTGALISASIWNTDIVENLKYFKDAPVFDGDISVGDDIFLTSTGAVINFASGDVTITHSTNTLTFAGAASGYVFNDGNLVVDTNTLYVDATNNRVGIGTSSPSFPLHAMTTGTGTTAAANAVARFASNGTGYDVFCQFSDTVTNSGGIGMLSGNMYIHAGGAERMRIDTNGNVGIGVTPGSVRLDIVGSTDAIRVTQSTTNATSKDGKYLQRHYTNSEEDLLVAYSYSTSTDNGLAFGGGSGAQNAATLIGFYTAANNTTVSGTERLRINSSGHVGIGATARFYLDGVAGTGDTYMLESSANIIDVYAGGQACSFQSTAFTALVDNNLNLGFSTLFRWKAVYAVNGTIQTSDARRKREIEPSDLGSDFLRAIAPVSFIYEDMPHRRYGLIAQDIIAAANGRSLEGIITQDDDEKGYYGLNYAALVTPLVSGWQDHDSRIAALEAKIAALEARIH